MATRILVSDVIKSGSRLYELLMEEPKLKVHILSVDESYGYESLVLC